MKLKCCFIKKEVDKFLKMNGNRIKKSYFFDRATVETNFWFKKV